MRALPLALALLCVLAGCSGLDPATDRPTTDPGSVTPAEVPRDLHGGTIAPGLTEGRLVNRTALLAANRAALRNESLTLRWHGTTVTTSREGTYSVVPWSTEGRHGADRRRSHYVSRNEAVLQNGSRQELWIGPDRAVGMVASNGSREYRSIAPEVADRNRRVSPALRGLQGVDRVTVERAGTTESGDARYRVRAVAPSLPDGILGTRERFETRNVSVATTVDERGVVHRYRFSYELRAEDGGQWHRVSTAYALRAVGETTVERPGWYDEAVDATGNRTAPG